MSLRAVNTRFQKTVLAPLFLRVANSAGLCELDGFCTEAYLHRKGAILRRMYEYYLIYMHANGTGAP